MSQFNPLLKFYIITFQVTERIQENRFHVPRLRDISSTWSHFREIESTWNKISEIQSLNSFFFVMAAKRQEAPVFK